MKKILFCIGAAAFTAAYSLEMSTLYGAGNAPQAQTEERTAVKCSKKGHVHRRTIDSEIKQCFPERESVKQAYEPFNYVQVYGRGKTLIGICFYAEDVIDDVQGFKGPMSILIGLTPQGQIKGVFIIEHDETLEYAQHAFSEAFLSQFRDEKIRGGFLTGKDIQAVSGATISSNAVIRIVKNAAAAAYACLLSGPALPPGTSGPGGSAGRRIP